MSKILVVDDEEHIRTLYGDELTDEGYEVHTDASGRQVVEKIETFRPDVVILDIKMVDVDGLELLQKIRERYHDLSVILCSAYDSYKAEPRSAAADFYVIKSFDLTELKTRIHQACC